MVHFEVELYGPKGAGFELDRLAEGPTGETVMRMEAALAEATVVTEGRIHVITGGLKASLHPSSSFDGDSWEGTLSAARHPGIFELARGNAPTMNHPEGGHYFYDPGGPDFERDVRRAVWDWVTSDHGGEAPSGDLHPWSGG